MRRYALLVRPAANRVFGGVAGALLRSELDFASRHLLGGSIADLGETEIAGLGYVTFTATSAGSTPFDDAGHDDGLLASVVANAASTYAVFERIEGVDGELLRPVPLRPLDRYDDDLVTTQRYVGKTNETVTKLLVNLALHAADGALTALVEGRRVRILDPLCGRGTTLNQALLYGADALGVDVDAKDAEAYATFLRTWLQEKRLKHQIDPTAGRNRFRVSVGRKGAASADDRQIVDVRTADTVAGTAALGRNAVDVLVADLPYGVQHGARTEAAGLARRPSALLEEALPTWRAAVRPGGAIALSWNVRLLPRAAMVSALEAAGLAVCDDASPSAFEHRVDRVITRDLVVARRPG